MMDPEVKAKWVKALRSGKYKQTTGQLRKGEGQYHQTKEGSGYCCLGVLCELDQRVWFDGQNNAMTGTEGIGFGALEAAGMRMFGIPARVHNRLVELNDGERGGVPTESKDFNQIADWIEKSKQL